MRWLKWQKKENQVQEKVLLNRPIIDLQKRVLEKPKNQFQENLKQRLQQLQHQHSQKMFMNQFQQQDLALLVQEYSRKKQRVLDGCPFSG